MSIKCFFLTDCFKISRMTQRITSRSKPYRFNYIWILQILVQVSPRSVNSTDSQKRNMCWLSRPNPLGLQLASTRPSRFLSSAAQYRSAAHCATYTRGLHLHPIGSSRPHTRPPYMRCRYAYINQRAHYTLHLYAGRRIGEMHIPAILRPANLGSKLARNWSTVAPKNFKAPHCTKLGT